jgi:hypothetical protein
VIGVPRDPAEVQVKIRIALLVFLWPLYLLHVLTLVLFVLLRNLYDLAATLVAPLFLASPLLLQHHRQLEITYYLLFLLLVLRRARPLH